MVPEGRTERLILKPLALADAIQIQALFPHWQIVRFLASRVPWPYPPDGAQQFCRETALPQMERGDAWHWTLRLIEAPEQIIGMISLMRGEEENRGFWVGLPWQGHGYMSEACDWATDFWFETLGFERLRVPKAVGNVASRHISEKQGMRLIRVEERDYVCGRLKSEIWEITAEEWRARNVSRSAAIQATADSSLRSE